jgi:hypothetical protein
MILICTLIGTLLTNLIVNTSTSQEILYCSNVNALNKFGFPETNSSLTPTSPKADVPGATMNVINVNYAYTIGSAFFIISPLAATTFCSYWMTNRYPSSAIYEPAFKNYSLLNDYDDTFLFILI